MGGNALAECFLLAGFIPLSAQVLEDVVYINETMPGSEYAGYTLNNVTFEDSVNDLILFGEDATIVISVYDSNDAAQAAFINLFQDFDGNSVDWSPDTVADFVVGGGCHSRAVLLCGNFRIFCSMRGLARKEDEINNSERLMGAPEKGALYFLIWKIILKISETSTWISLICSV